MVKGQGQPLPPLNVFEPKLPQIFGTLGAQTDWVLKVMGSNVKITQMLSDWLGNDLYRSVSSWTLNPTVTGSKCWDKTRKGLCTFFSPFFFLTFLPAANGPIKMGVFSQTSGHKSIFSIFWSVETCLVAMILVLFVHSNKYVHCSSEPRCWECSIFSTFVDLEHFVYFVYNVLCRRVDFLTAFLFFCLCKRAAEGVLFLGLFVCAWPYT